MIVRFIRKHCEAASCTRSAKYRKDHEAWLCDTHAEVASYSAAGAPAKRHPLSWPERVVGWILMGFVAVWIVLLRLFPQHHRGKK